MISATLLNIIKYFLVNVLTILQLRYMVENVVLIKALTNRLNRRFNFEESEVTVMPKMIQNVRNLKNEYCAFVITSVSM